MAENNVVPIIVECTEYEQIRILHEFRGLANQSNSSLNEVGKLVGRTKVFALWRFLLIPRMGGLEKMSVLEEHSEIIEIETDEFWSSLAAGAFDPSVLETDYPQLTFRNLGDLHPAVIRAKALADEMNSPDYQWEWLCELDLRWTEQEPKYYLFKETNVQQGILRMTGIPMYGGIDHCTTSIQTRNDETL